LDAAQLSDSLPLAFSTWLASVRVVRLRPRPHWASGCRRVDLLPLGGSSRHGDETSHLLGFLLPLGLALPTPASSSPEAPPPPLQGPPPSQAWLRSSLSYRSFVSIFFFLFFTFLTRPPRPTRLYRAVLNSTLATPARSSMDAFPPQVRWGWVECLVASRPGHLGEPCDPCDRCFTLAPLAPKRVVLSPVPGSPTSSSRRSLPRHRWADATLCGLVSPLPSPANPPQPCPS